MVNKPFDADIFILCFLLIVNMVRVKTQLLVLTKKKCWWLQADFR